jgi:hypothetical protein
MRCEKIKRRHLLRRRSLSVIASGTARDERFPTLVRPFARRPLTRLEPGETPTAHPARRSMAQSLPPTHLVAFQATRPRARVATRASPRRRLRKLKLNLRWSTRRMIDKLLPRRRERTLIWCPCCCLSHFDGIQRSPATVLEIAIGSIFAPPPDDR